MHKALLCTLLLCTPALRLGAQSRSAVAVSTDVLMFATPVAGLVTTLALGDYRGTKQLVLGGATALAASYLLKYTIRKDRPDGSRGYSFPSNHTSVSFQGAAFIQRRYGWKFGIPAYLLSVYVAWGRVYARKHDSWDILAGAAIGVACSYLYTRPLAKKHRLVVAPVVLYDEHPGLYLSLTF